jgi:peptide-methionine (S)-S-oxide reductase
MARALIARLDAEGPWDDAIVTEVAPLDAFHRAEAYHDEYYGRNPTQPYCHVVIGPKVARFRKSFAHRLAAPR